MTLPPLATTWIEPAPGERFAVDRLAGDAPCYVYLHGFASVRTGEKSNALVRHAHARGRAAMRFDFRGHGDSTGTIGHVTFSELLADAGLVLDAAGPSFLVGTSLGALVAAHLAATRPQEVLGLALIAPAFGWLPGMARRLDDRGHMQTTEGISVRIHERALADAARHDEKNLPARLPMPVFVAHGTADEVVPHVLSERFFAAIPHPRKDLWIVADGDHRLTRDIDAIYGRMERLFAAADA